MSGTLPINDFVKITFTSVHNSSTSTSVSGRRQTRHFPTQYWRLDCDYRSLQRTDAAKVMAFIAKQRNNLFDFDLVLPDFSYTQGTVTAMLAANPATSSTLSVSTQASAFATQVSVSSAWDTAKWTTAGVSASTGLRAGDFISFSNHTKIYQLTDDVSFNSSGAATLNVYPALITTVPNAATVNYNAVLFRVYLREPAQQYDFGLYDSSSITLSLQESL